MLLPILSGVLAVLAVLVLPLGRWLLKKVKAKGLAQINSETRGLGDPQRSGKIIDRYASGVSVVEAVSVLLLASAVLCLACDTLHQRMTQDKALSPTAGQAAAGRPGG